MKAEMNAVLSVVMLSCSMCENGLKILADAHNMVEANGNISISQLSIHKKISDFSLKYEIIPEH